MPLFGAAFAAPNKGATILYWFRSLSTVLSPTENRRIQRLFMAFESFSSTFNAYLIFKDFSRKPFKFKYFSSLCEPCKGIHIFKKLSRIFIHTKENGFLINHTNIQISSLTLVLLNMRKSSLGYSGSRSASFVRNKIMGESSKFLKSWTLEI